jgi:hypothetical protein
MNTDYLVEINLEEQITPEELAASIVGGLQSYNIGIKKIFVPVVRLRGENYYKLLIKLEWEEPPEEIAAIIHNQLLDYGPTITAQLHWLDA